MIGLVKKFKSYAILCRVATYLDLVEAVGPSSKVFEGKGLMIYEVKPSVKRTIEELDDFSNCASMNDDITTHLRQFHFVVNDSASSENVLVPVFKSPGDGKRQLQNRRETVVDMSYLNHLDNESIQQAFAKKKDVAVEIKNSLTERFDDYDKTILEAMKWFDPINWQCEKTYGISEIEKIYTHFQATLDAAQCNRVKVVNEWVNFRRYVSATFRNLNGIELWPKIFRYKKDEYPNLCLLAELIIAISGSNSTVERAFSVLTNMLSDQRLCSHHATMNMLLNIRINDQLWHEEDKEVIDRVLDIYLEKRRNVTLSKAVIALESIEEPLAKKACVETSDNDNDDLSSEYDDLSSDDLSSDDLSGDDLSGDELS